MIYDIDNLPKAFNLGRQGENLVTYIEIDCAAMGERKFDYDFNADPPNVTTSWEYAK